MLDSQSSTLRRNRTICLPITPVAYEAMIQNPVDVRKTINDSIDRFPELFPSSIHEGYRMKDSYKSKKLGIVIRRIQCFDGAYSIRPSFVMPYMVALTEEVEKPLFLRKFSVPFWALAYTFGKNAMYWFRIEQSLGRNSLVGTTIQHPDTLPEHACADEKHCWRKGEKVYVATTVGGGCILGASVAADAGDQSLTKAYGVFKEEVHDIDPKYAPKTVNTDGWKATQKAWTSLFPSAAIICCFLHVFIKIRDRAKKKYQDIFRNIASELWECYNASSKAAFTQMVQRLFEKCKNLPSVILSPIQKLWENIESYSIAYDYPGVHRTSNMLDRLMQRMDRHLFAAQYFHGFLKSAQLSIRAWALINNFAPSNPWTVKIHGGNISPAVRLNKSQYHDNWLQNLLVSASLRGFRGPPQNPL